MQDETWLVPSPDRCQRCMQLICFPHAGAGTAAFHSWVRMAREPLSITTVRFPGRESRIQESPVDCIAAAVDPIANAIRRAVRGPFALFGHSLGGLVAFEVARELARRPGPQPRHLFVSAAPPPQLPWPHPPLHDLPEDEFLAALAERYRPIPDALLGDAEFRRLVLRTLRADFRMVETHRYTPGVPLAYPVTAFGATDDTSVGFEQLTHWNEMTTEGSKVVPMSGGHFYIESAARLVLKEVLNALSGDPKYELDLARCGRD